MAKYKVRDGFVVHLPNRVHEAGDIIELSSEESDLVAHQIEPIPIEPIPTTKTKEKTPNDGNKE